MFEQVVWVEKYRPHKIQDCILPKSLKDTFQAFVDSGDLSVNLLLTGPAGIGKTTVAKALCDELGCDYLFLNGSDNDDSGIAAFRTKVKGYASASSFDGKRKVIIFDEADYLSATTQPALRSAIEELAANCSFIFTCNFKAKIIEPLHSRCTVIDFRLKNADKPALASELMARLKQILDAEDVTYKPKVLAEILKKFFPDFRRTLNELQKVSIQSGGNIDENVLGEVSADVSFAELIKNLKAKDFGLVRQWAAKNSDLDPTRVFRQIYDAAYDVLEPKSIPAAVLVLAEYSYRNSFVADPELNTAACLTQLMVQCDWKND